MVRVEFLRFFGIDTFIEDFGDAPDPLVGGCDVPLGLHATTTHARYSCGLSTI
jgi:hypothetical protein